jgi:signal transduction histidine kinase/DNA-binding response OmpR family regulator/methyl-accepting chemotaxis protein
MTRRSLSLRAKTTLIGVVTSAAVSLLGLATFLAWDLVSFRRDMANDLSTQAEIVAVNSAAAAAFDDPAGAGQALRALGAKSEIVMAAVYRRDAQLLASYRSPAARAEPLPARPPAMGVTTWGGSHIDVFHPIARDGERLGTVFVRSDLSLWYARLRRIALASLAMLAFAVPLSLLLATWLQRYISGPVLRLAAGMREVSATRDYSIRVHRDTDDEVGELVAGFNEMLGRIQRRDSALQEAHARLQARTADLEREVAERTRAQAQLAGLTATLEQRVAEGSRAAEQRAHELARSERALRDQTRTLQSVFASMADAVMVTDETQRIVLWNESASRLLGIPSDREPVLSDVSRHGHRCAETGQPIGVDDLPSSRALRGETVTGEVLIAPPAQPGGRQRWLSVNAQPIEGLEGRHAAVSVTREITAQKEAEAALVAARDAAEAANRAKSAFLANMSHELRTPLNAIIGFSEMMLDEAEDRGDTTQVADLRKIRDSGRHLLALINDVLDLSKIEAGRIDLSVEPFDVVAFALELQATARPLAAKNGNALEVTVAPDAGVLRSDQLKVRQILLNLLGNACKFTHDGRVSLGVRRYTLDGRDWIEWRVADTGIGIERDTLDRLFSEFTQADTSVTRRFGGTGLGLAISRRLGDLLGGTITVDSTPGSGSVFTLVVPAAPVADPTPQSAAAEAPASAGPGDYVLVIDDDPLARDLVVRHLKREGLEAVEAASGAEGLALARARRPAAVVLDVLMPEMDGWAVLADLRAEPTLARVPVVMLTIVGEPARGLALGAADYLQKPLDAAAFTEVVRRHLGGPGQRDVLVVEDDESTRQLFARRLEANGYVARLAADGLEAVALCDARTPDLVMLDLAMPAMDGFEFLERLRSTPATSQVPVVVVSGLHLSEDQRELLRQQVSHVVAKRGTDCEQWLPAVARQLRAQSTPARAAR